MDFHISDTMLSMLQVPNGTGVLFGVGQLALHAMYGRNKIPVADQKVIDEMHLNLDGPSIVRISSYSSSKLQCAMHKQVDSAKESQALTIAFGNFACSWLTDPKEGQRLIVWRSHRRLLTKLPEYSHLTAPSTQMED
jgi:hypothetical protein